MNHIVILLNFDWNCKPKVNYYSKKTHFNLSLLRLSNLFFQVSIFLIHLGLLILKSMLIHISPIKIRLTKFFIFHYFLIF